MILIIYTAVRLEEREDEVFSWAEINFIRARIFRRNILTASPGLSLQAENLEPA